jgi:hypothetical protein
MVWLDDPSACPKVYPSNGKNTIGIKFHTDAPQNGIYYSLMGQNCVWWATVMLMQNGFNPLPANVSNAILKYNGGDGYANDVVQGRRSPSKQLKMDDVLEGQSLPGVQGVEIPTGL